MDMKKALITELYSYLKKEFMAYDVFTDGIDETMNHRKLETEVKKLIHDTVFTYDLSSVEQILESYHRAKIEVEKFEVAIRRIKKIKKRTNKDLSMSLCDDTSSHYSWQVINDNDV